MTKLVRISTYEESFKCWLPVSFTMKKAPEFVYMDVKTQCAACYSRVAKICPY